MAKIDVNKAVELSGYNGQFKDSLKDVIRWANSDSRITSDKELAYLLATAKIESGYSLQRWESDYLCGNVGQPYQNKPCQSALNYYASTSGKKNYYTLGTDPKGLPYFGRGLIQLTGKGNYEAYGKILGVPLLSKPDLALKPRNSYDIAVEYMKRRGTFQKVHQGDLYGARRTVGSGGKSLEVSQAYHKWMDILSKSKKISIFGSGKGAPKTQEQKNRNKAIAISLGVVFLAGMTILAVSRAKK